jgi:hypothetical protein
MFENEIFLFLHVRVASSGWQRTSSGCAGPRHRHSGFRCQLPTQCSSRCGKDPRKHFCVYWSANRLMKAFIVLVTLSLSTGDAVATPVTTTGQIKNERWEQEILFHALWIPVEGQLLVFAYGTDLGFDQVLWVNPSTGVCTAWQANLAENDIFFQVDNALSSF